MNTYKPIDASTLTHKDRKDALASLLFIAENRNGDIKAKKVTVDSKERTYNRYNKKQ